MLKNYFKIAFRNLFKEKLFSVINIIGLSVGTAVAILMILFVKEEWSFDQFHSKSDRIYRAWVKEHFKDNIFFNTVTPYVLGRELEANFPEVEEMARFLTVNNLVKKGTFSDQEQIHVATPSFLSVFDFKLLKGDKDQALDDLQSVVLTEAIAQKYFGPNPAMGQTLTVQIGGEWREFEVSGIIESAPANSSIQYDMLVSFENLKYTVSERTRNNWQVVNPETYALLKEGQSITGLEAKFQSFVDEKVANIYKPGEYKIGFQPITDIHLNTDFPQGIAPVSDWRYPYIMAAIAGLILLLAGINFVTLAVGRSVTRAKEVGVRKVSGASRWQLMTQFWSEAILLTIVAVSIGVLLTETSLGFFNNLANKTLSLNYNIATILLFLSLAIFIGILAGIYPALVISGFSPLKTLKESVSKLGTSKHVILRSLVGFQFVLSVTLIICTLIMSQQMRFLQEKNLGYEKDQMVILPYVPPPSGSQRISEIYEEGRQAAQLLKTELASNPNIKDLTTSSHTFGTPGWVRAGYTDPESKKFKQFYLQGVDYNYLNMMDIELLDGRNFSDEVGTDARSGVIVNEAYIEEFGLEAKAGQQLPKPFDQYEIVGVTKDFNFSSLHNEVEPLVMAMNFVPILGIASDMNATDSPFPKITLNLAGGTIPSSITAIKNAWNKVAPEQPFNFSFMDDAVNNQYLAESQLNKILTSSTILGILIACLGLFGMATMTIARRTKEIGVRKILGASVTDIVFMLNKRFTWMVLLASVIATPLAFYLMKNWLQDFAYHINIKPFVFILATLMVLLISWFAVSYHSIRAALSNPVKALRYE